MLDKKSKLSTANLILIWCFGIFVFLLLTFIFKILGQDLMALFYGVLIFGCLSFLKDNKQRNIFDLIRQLIKY
jgi:hypothetical protein